MYTPAEAEAELAKLQGGALYSTSQILAILKNAALAADRVNDRLVQLEALLATEPITDRVLYILIWVVSLVSFWTAAVDGYIHRSFTPLGAVSLIAGFASLLLGAMTHQRKIDKRRAHEDELADLRRFAHLLDAIERAGRQKVADMAGTDPAPDAG
jgi:hypothetical protein